MVCLALCVIVSAGVVSAFEDDALSVERDNGRSLPSTATEMATHRGIISKMIERGK